MDDSGSLYSEPLEQAHVSFCLLFIQKEFFKGLLKGLD